MLKKGREKDREMLDQIISNQRKDAVDQIDKVRHLNDFYERHEEIMSQERRDAAQQIKMLNDEKDEIERNLKKQLDATQTELDSLQSEI